jgi:serine/threonine protein kinase
MGDPILIDFGSASVDGKLPGECAGVFRSPERPEGSPPSAVSDVYSLGVMLSLLLFGAPPMVGPKKGLFHKDTVSNSFHGSRRWLDGELGYFTLSAVASRRLVDEQTLTSLLGLFMPIIERAASFHQEDRYQTVSDLNRDVSKLMPASSALKNDPSCDVS